MPSCYKPLNFVETVEESTCYMLKALFYENQKLKLDMVGHNDWRKWPLPSHITFLNGQWPALILSPDNSSLLEDNFYIIILASFTSASTLDSYI